MSRGKMTYVVPDKHLTWQGIYDYVFNTIGLIENDKNPGEATDLRELFAQKVSYVAKVGITSAVVSSTASSSGKARSTTNVFPGWKA